MKEIKTFQDDLWTTICSETGFKLVIDYNEHYRTDLQDIFRVIKEQTQIINYYDV